MSMLAVWLVAFIFFIVVEVLTTALIGLWFIFGALISFIIALISPDSVLLQLFVFLIVSFLMLIFLRPFAKKYAKPKAKSNVEALIGQVGIVTEEIDSSKESGRVKVNFQDWGAISADPTLIINVGESVLVKDIVGIKLIVEKS